MENFTPSVIDSYSWQKLQTGQDIGSHIAQLSGVYGKCYLIHIRNQPDIELEILVR